MFTEMGKRMYKQDKRAEQTADTRQRIVDAIVALHATVGPARTNISAIAEKAGVQRLTVYRHFDDEAAIFQACTTHYRRLNPPPDPLDWQGIKDPAARTHKALTQLYGFYRRTRPIWHNSYRDVEQTPALRPHIEEFEGWLGFVRDDLLQAWRPSKLKKTRAHAVLTHAVAFQTWESLSSTGLSDAVIAEMVEKWLRAL